MTVIAFITVATWLLWGTIFGQIVGSEVKGNQTSIAIKRNCFLVMMVYMMFSLILAIGVIVSETYQ